MRRNIGTLASLGIGLLLLIAPVYSEIRWPREPLPLCMCAQGGDCWCEEGKCPCMDHGELLREPVDQ